MKDDPESRRLHQDPASWKRQGPHLAERAWSTVREDYSSNGYAWECCAKSCSRRIGIMIV